MDPEKAFDITWKQLPQRSLWLKAPSHTSVEPTSVTQVLNKIGTPYQAKVPAKKQPGGWEYLDHTADVQIHSWGASLSEAFGAAVVGMFGYMVELDEIDGNLEIQIAVDGHDLQSLLYAIMNECLYSFHTEQFVGKEVIIKYLDTREWKLGAVIRGGSFDAAKHSQGTEVKAITYSNMQIIEETDDRVATYVIVDI